MKRWSFFVALVLAGSCFGETDALAILGETITPKTLSGQCASGGTVFENRTPNSMSFDLSIQNSAGLPCPITVSWNDATGKSQSITVSASLAVATSLAPNAAILWSSQGNGNVNFNWYLSQSVSVTNNGSSLSCQSSLGTLYENLSPAPVNLNLALTVQRYSASLRWLDTSGTPQELYLAGGVNGKGLPTYQNSEGVAISLPPGGTISFVPGPATSLSVGGAIPFVSDPGNCPGSAWQWERTVGDE